MNNFNVFLQFGNGGSILMKKKLKVFCNLKTLILYLQPEL